MVILHLLKVARAIAYLAGEQVSAEHVAEAIQCRRELDALMEQVRKAT